MSKVGSFLAQSRGVDIPKYPNKIPITNTEIHMGVISREELIQHKADYARLAKIDAPNTSG